MLSSFWISLEIPVVVTFRQSESDSIATISPMASNVDKYDTNNSNVLRVHVGVQSVHKPIIAVRTRVLDELCTSPPADDEVLVAW